MVSLKLQSADLRPRDLVGLSAVELRDALEVEPSLAERLTNLLSRGGQLAFEIERLSSRGMWIVTRADEAYPSVLKQRLRGHAPPLLFGAGPQAGLQLRAIAIVGSRDVDGEGLAFASALARRCAEQGYAVVSGAARGVDIEAMAGALSVAGAAIGITVDPLERLVQRRDLRLALADELLTLATPFHPAARWHQGNAMKRNRLIYAIAQAAVVVASSVDKGGTRSGAKENLSARWVPLHVRDDGSPGNRKLIAEGALPLQNDVALDGFDVEQLTAEPPGRQLGLQGPAEESGRPGDQRVADVDDPFVVVWPILARHLREPLGERDVAERAHLQLTQARAWLKRAVAEGYLEIKTRPKRYVLRADAAEQLRIDDT